MSADNAKELEIDPTTKSIGFTVAGSASSSPHPVVQYPGDYFVQSSYSLDVLHRLIFLASITFGPPAHCTGCILMLGCLDLNHKSTYKHAFLFDTVISLIAVIICTMLASALY